MSATHRALRIGRPIWLRDAPRVTRSYPALSGRLETSVAIVGGGLTGALVAHAFASAGVATVVLEASAVGKGSTAASSALLLQEPDLEFAQLTARHGSRSARRVWSVCQESVRALIALLERLRPQCHLARRDAIYYARDADGAERLDREFQLRRGAGFDADWLTPGELRNATGIPGRAGIRTRGNAQCDPYLACKAVLRSAVARGAQVFEGSRVRRIDATRNHVRIRTGRGVLDAQRVVIATGYATPEFRPLAGRFRMYRTYVLATEPLEREQRVDVGLSDVMVWDTARPYHYARWTPDRRLLLGGGDRLVRPGPGRRRQFQTAASELREYFESVLPAVATIEIASAWEGLFAMTADSLPYIGPHRRYPAHWFALGYGGNGMTFGALAARLLLERWQNVKSRDHELFSFNRTARP